MATRTRNCGNTLLPPRSGPDGQYSNHQDNLDLSQSWSGSTHYWSPQAVSASLPHSHAALRQPFSDGQSNVASFHNGGGHPRIDGVSSNSTDAFYRQSEANVGEVVSHHESMPTSSTALQGSPKPPFFCLQHGCNGRAFTNFSNYRRHCREKSQTYAKPECPRCGQKFLRESGRDSHVEKQLCKAVGVDANGVLVWTSLDSQEDDVCLLL